MPGCPLPWCWQQTAPWLPNADPGPPSHPAASAKYPGCPALLFCRFPWLALRRRLTGQAGMLCTAMQLLHATHRVSTAVKVCSTRLCMFCEVIHRGMRCLPREVMHARNAWDCEALVSVQIARCKACVHLLGSRFRESCICSRLFLNAVIRSRRLFFSCSDLQTGSQSLY